MGIESIHPLSLILFIPTLGAVIIALFIRDAKAVKLTAAAFTLVAFILSLIIFIQFDRSGGLQFVEQANWIGSIGAQYYLGVDGLSLPMVILTTFLGFVSVFISWKVSERTREFFIWILLLETGILGVFMSLDLLLFFLFWEVELIPMYMLISIWGTPPPLGRKEYSATKFVIYTLFGSAFMMAGILSLYFSTPAPHTFDMVAIATGGLGWLQPVMPLAGIFFLIFAAFAIKLPVFPLHTWLPDAHTDAPTAVSVILAGVLLKMGAYGMIRLVAGFGGGGLVPGVAEHYSQILIVFAVISVLYGAAATMRQTDLKKMIAYSSVSHMGFVLLGIFALTQLSLAGAAMQMFSHGLITGLLFAMVGLVYEKTHERRIPFLGGLARQMPVITVVFSIAGLAALGLPTTIGFAAEFTVFAGSYGSTAFPGIQVMVVLAILGIVVGAGYILWMLERVFYRDPLEKYDGVGDANTMEKAYIFAFVALIMLFGVYPRLLLDVVSPMFSIWG
ncbi:MAG: NADH-quinone oxidoreductase subunit M [Chloroflexota bacterium]|nr:NADH-quinone oxidoreductase subunit M [Chloroflexota bacterium]